MTPLIPIDPRQPTTCHCDLCGAMAESFDYVIPAGWQEIVSGRHACAACLGKVQGATGHGKLLG